MSARSFASGDAMAESEPDPVRPVEPLPVVAPDEVARAIDTADKATSIRFIRTAPFYPVVAPGNARCTDLPKGAIPPRGATCNGVRTVRSAPSPDFRWAGTSGPLLPGSPLRDAGHSGASR